MLRMWTVCLVEGRAFVSTYRSLSNGDRELRMKDGDEQIRECCGASLGRVILECEGKIGLV